MLRRRGIDDQTVAEQDRMPAVAVDDLQHAGAAAEEDDLDDVGEGEILEPAEKTHEARLWRFRIPSRIPLMNCDDFCVPNFFPISMASSMITSFGVSDSSRSS